MDTPRCPTVDELKEVAIRMRSEGNNDDIILARIMALMVGSTDDERRTRADLVEQALNLDPRWGNPAAPSYDEATAGPSSNARGKQPATGNGDNPDPAALLAALMERLGNVEAENARMRASYTQQSTPPTLPEQGLNTPVVRAKHIKYPDPEQFDGDRRNYRTWKFQMLNKLQQDGEYIGTAANYVFSRLKGQAANVALSWIDRNRFGTINDMWEFLDGQFADKLQSERAQRKLQNIRQGKSSLATFNADFMRLAYDAGEETNHHSLRTRYLTALRSDLQDRMVSVDVPDHWSIQDVMNRVTSIEENLFRAKLHRNHNFPQRSTGDAMDWEPTKAHAARDAPSSKKYKAYAKWASEEDRTKRRANNLCLRCGKSGHYQGKCDLGPARKPAQAAKASVEVVEDGDRIEELSDSEN